MTKNTKVVALELNSAGRPLQQYMTSAATDIPDDDDGSHENGSESRTSAASLTFCSHDRCKFPQSTEGAQLFCDITFMEMLSIFYGCCIVLLRLEVITNCLETKFIKGRSESVTKCTQNYIKTHLIVILSFTLCIAIGYRISGKRSPQWLAWARRLSNDKRNRSLTKNSLSFTKRYCMSLTRRSLGTSVSWLADFHTLSLKHTHLNALMADCVLRTVFWVFYRATWRRHQFMKTYLKDFRKLRDAASEFFGWTNLFDHWLLVLLHAIRSMGISPSR